MKYTDEAMASLGRLYRRQRVVFREAKKMIGLISEAPYIGKPLVGRWTGARSVRFRDDDYRVIWEIDEDERVVIVLLVGRKKPTRRGTIYDQPRPDWA